MHVDFFFVAKYIHIGLAFFHLHNFMLVYVFYFTIINFNITRSV